MPDAALAEVQDEGELRDVPDVLHHDDHGSFDFAECFSKFFVHVSGD